MVLLPTDHGPVAARVVWAAEYSSEDTDGFPMLLGMASAADLAATEELRTDQGPHDGRQPQAHPRARAADEGARRRPAGRQPARPSSTTRSPETVDFRSLLRDLSATLGSRIELRQLAARDTVRVTGAIGSCGRDTCCSTFLKDYEPITLAMARDQDLPANPMRISGACGRLMCCLKYEHPLYQDFKATAPAIGEEVDSPAGPGRVVGALGARRLRRASSSPPTVPSRSAPRRRCAVAQGLRGAPPAAGLTRRSRGQNSDASIAPTTNADAATQIHVGRRLIGPPCTGSCRNHAAVLDADLDGGQRSLCGTGQRGAGRHVEGAAVAGAVDPAVADGADEAGLMRADRRERTHILRGGPSEHDRLVLQHNAAALGNVGDGGDRSCRAAARRRVGDRRLVARGIRDSVPDEPADGGDDGD